MPVVDASIVVDWVAPDVDPHGPARQLLAEFVRSGTRVIGPRLLLEEVGNALLTGCRRGRWSGEKADQAFELLRELPIHMLDERADVVRAWELSRRYDQHPVYDMIYVALAERLGERLVTVDGVLLRRLSRLGFVVPLSSGEMA